MNSKENAIFPQYKTRIFHFNFNLQKWRKIRAHVKSSQLILAGRECLIAAWHGDVPI